MKIVLDTNVVYSGLAFGGNCLKVLDYCFNTNNIELFVSTSTLKELSNKLFSDKFKKYNDKPKEDIINFVEQYILESNLIEPKMVVNICRDPNDNIFFELALEASVDYIISGDQDILSCKKEFELICECKLVTPKEFLQLI
jgi:putative PIN family toxin of toxin-antitoxin system